MWPDNASRCSTIDSEHLWFQSTGLKTCREWTCSLKSILLRCSFWSLRPKDSKLWIFKCFKFEHRAKQDRELSWQTTKLHLLHNKGIKKYSVHLLAQMVCQKSLVCWIAYSPLWHPSSEKNMSWHFIVKVNFIWEHFHFFPFITKPLVPWCTSPANCELPSTY